MRELPWGPHLEGLLSAPTGPQTRSYSRQCSPCGEDVVVAEATVCPHRENVDIRHRKVVVVTNEGRQSRLRRYRRYPHVRAEHFAIGGAGIERVEVDVGRVEPLVLPDNAEPPV